MSDRLKNAFINKYKPEPVPNEVVANKSADESIYNNNASNSLAPSFLVAILIIVTLIIIFTLSSLHRDKDQIDSPAKPLASLNDNALSAKAADYESVTFLKVNFYDGVESYELSLPLTLQESDKRNIIVALETAVSLSKKKIVIDLGPFEGTIEVVLKDSSLQSNNFDPYIINSSSERQIVELNVDNLPANLLSEVNLYRIIELRLKLDKAGTININSISLQ